MSQYPFPTRAPLLACRGMVVSGHPLATGAALRVLMDGGNAVDAALTASGVLAVVMPPWCGVGGDAFSLAYDPARGVQALNGSGAAPLAATLEAFPEGRVPRFGARAVGVPGLVDAWATAAAYATRPLGELLAPAIHYASHGFPIDSKLGAAIEAVALQLDEWPGLRRLLAPTGRLPRAGEVLRQPELAETLALIAREGRQAFYEGPIGAALAAALTRRGGLLTCADLARHRTVWQEPISVPYRGHVVFEQPLVSQGCILLEELAILDGCDDVGRHPWGSAQVIDLLVRAKQAAFADTARYLGDPAAVDVPLERLLAAANAAEWRARILESAQAGVPLEVGARAAATSGSDTECLVVADGRGGVVCWIQSLFNQFGAREVAEGTGIILNDRLANLSLDPLRPNALRPGRKPLHTLNTFLVCRDGRPMLAGATPGGQGQVQTNLQVIVDVLDYGFDVQAAVAAPRWVSGSRTPNDPTLYLESSFPPPLGDELRARGHPVAVVEAGDGERFGSATLIGMDPVRGVLSGGADPRRSAHAIGW